MQPGLQEIGIDMKHKPALHKVFFDALISTWCPGAQSWINGREIALVFDSEKDLGCEDMALQSMRSPEGFYEGSLIHVDSRVEIGVQLADVVAYTFNRIHHAHHRQILGRTNAFDELILNAAERLTPKLIQLLDIKN